MADRRNPDDDLTLGPGAKISRPQTAVGGPASTIAPGQLLAHTYRIEALLARGGMVLVILSPQPLFQKARPQEEDGDDAGAYLADLGVALTAIAQRVGPGKLSVATSSLTFVAR